MSELSSKNSDQGQHSDITDDENFENDDLVEFKHDSKTINFYYSQLTKYSTHIREAYLFSDVTDRFPEEMRKFQEESQLLSESVDYFFQLLQQNYNISEDLTLTYIQCVDLLKISKFLEVRKLSSKIKQYIKAHDIDVDFIIQMIQYNIKTQKETENQEIEISNEIENILSNEINECFSNDKFKELPVQIIYRIIRKSSPDVINSNKLFDIIVKSLTKFCVLFQFLDLQKLSEDRLEELCEMHSKSNENTKHCFDYLKCNLELISGISIRKKSLEEMNDEQRNKLNDLETLLQKQLSDSEKVNNQLQNQLDDSKKLINEQHDKMKDLEAKIELLQSQMNDSNDLNSKQKNKISDFERQISLLQDKLADSEKQLSEIFKIKGQIVASVENGIMINAEINLKAKGPSLDTSRSKVIISTSNEKCIGSEAYENGELVTSLHMKTSFVRKSGTYYVRCIVYNSNGESNEIVSNSVTTSGSSLTFDYKGKEPVKISLPQGKYKLEVWGAKGGDSTGNGDNNKNRGKQSTVQGGLGGYSHGILNLKQKETIYVYVGEQGHTSNSTEGSTTKGGFPDGGGTKTGYCSSFHTVPGTGGGSSSIRIGNNTDYTRVIVAGGGGGAGGSCYYVDPGGFGGGLSGGNCYYGNSLQSQGAGTQTSSTCGRGDDSSRNGDPGKFGSGATGKYGNGCHSGGGGGGGWYGGGSGGYGNHTWCSSGGGGSGWTFTESSLKTWQQGDSANASKFALNSTYYLTDTKCVGGNEEFPRPDGNGNEQGHNGNGFAKITLI